MRLFPLLYALTIEGREAKRNNDKETSNATHAVPFCYTPTQCSEQRAERAAKSENMNMKMLLKQFRVAYQVYKPLTREPHYHNGE